MVGRDQEGKARDDKIKEIKRERKVSQKKRNQKTVCVYCTDQDDLFGRQYG